MSCVGAVLVCRFRGVLDWVGAVDGIVLAAHNASMCALMYLFAAFFDTIGAFATWVAALVCGIFSTFVCVGNLRLSESQMFDRNVRPHVPERNGRGLRKIAVKSQIVTSQIVTSQVHFF